MVACTPQMKHKQNKKASMTVQNGAGCYMYPCDAISGVA